MHNAQWIRLTLAALTMVVFVAAASADYEVQPGDNLNRIAADLGITTADLAAANDLADPNLIRVGQILIVPGQAPGGAITHVVSPGETLAGIARKYGTSVGGLVSTNGLANPNLITIGQQLLVPTATSASASATSAPVPTGASHTVQAGETLAAIAARYGITVEVIAAANGITDTSTIYIGTVLQLTGSGFVAEAPQAVSVVHRVAAGENLAGLAAQFGTTVDALASTNGIADPNLIRVGQEIHVPSNTPSWSCPIPGARFFNDWGFPRSGGRFHEGNDLFAPRGTPVVAPVTGTALFLNGPIGGLQFRLYGEDGTTYIGSHMDTMGTDGYVTVGSQLGTVGDSGNAIGGRPHLHFEIHPGDGPAVNPFPTVQKYC